MVGGPFLKLGHEVDVLNVVTVVLEPIEHLVFDVLIEDEPIRHRSGTGWRERRAVSGFGGGSLVALLNLSHLLGIVVIVRERLVDVRNI
ncbi:hypothetical protein [Halorubrum ezzemoulense]|uniref:hypothetical protein n=1 Tax=Halorubrum ezzemoulense TaxID=337243 RepID=UPI00067773AB|nr:hypothetical protein [Halorubrum ezzemoulense]